jgi:hypothetical protein
MSSWCSSGNGPSPGETQAYTIGDLGSRRCVVTKLPLTGHSREAAIASGSSTTRLLGTFQGVEHVFIVGVGGGVPHYTDWGRHVSGPCILVWTPSVCRCAWVTW